MYHYKFDVSNSYFHSVIILMVTKFYVKNSKTLRGFDSQNLFFCSQKEFAAIFIPN